MKGDFTRSTFKKDNHYTSVRMQQGRVQMDADWNEQMDIQDYLGATEAIDVIGRTGAPKYGGGFSISADNNDLKISPGRIYVDGILCESEEETTYLTQPDFPQPPVMEAQGNYLVYLDVWRRHITALEDGNIREKALGGPDTATRFKTVWQVKLQSAEPAECGQIDKDWRPDDVVVSGKLCARANPGEESDDPCVLPPQGGYRRLENQLYRVEIHQSGAVGAATFKWSRDNSSIVARVDKVQGAEITVSYPVPGRLEEFAPGQWIELTDEDHELRCQEGIFLEISDIKSNVITVSTSPDTSIFLSDMKIRRWDSAGAVDIEIPVDNDGFIPLEDGVEIKFESGENYQTGDYWLIPARSATGDIEWPTGEFKDPDGITHHYCQLAVVAYDGETFTLLHDCRDIFPPLNEVSTGKGCCTVTVGDEETSFGDVETITDAIDQVQQGGRICLLPGIHTANVTISGAKNITITGCGKQTVVIPGEASTQPVFTIVDSRGITLENMDIIALNGTAIQVEKSESAGLRGIEISGNRIVALKHAVRVDDEDGEDITIKGNKIRMSDVENGDVAIYMGSKNSIIEDNDIQVVSSMFLSQNEITMESDSIWEYTLNEYPAEGFYAPGGIQIAGGSEGITIKGNQVIGGYWNGITLGHIPGVNTNADLDQLVKTHYGIDGNTLNGNLKEILTGSFAGIINHIDIVENEIKHKGLNGVGVVNFFSVKEIMIMVSVNDLTISGNTIEKCLGQVPGRDSITRSMLKEMAFGGVALADCENLIIRENRIEENGANAKAPVCGVFILYGERIDISDNHILNNGVTKKADLTDTLGGIGGGVVISMTIGKLLTEFAAGEIPLMDGFPAVKIHDNIVTQPLGKALYISAIGPVSVVGNHLVSRGIHPKILFFPYVAGAVMIINLGVSRDLFAGALVSSFKGAAQSAEVRQNASYYKSAGTINTVNGTQTSFDSANLQPDFFSTYKKCEPDYEYALTPGTPAAAAPAPRETGPIIQMLVYFPTGSVLFSNNRTTLDLRSKEMDFVISSQSIFSLDDISYTGNQSECNSLLDVVLTDVFTIGNTIRTNDNRFQEGLTLAFYSLLSIALMMNTWVGNQASNCITALGIAKETMGNNLVLYKNPLFGYFQIIKDKTFCEISRNALFALYKPGKPPELAKDISD